MAWRLSTGLRNKILGAAAGQGSLQEIFANGQIRIYTGTQPTNADTAETGSLLCTITLASGAMDSGVSTNGINLGNAADGTVGKASGEVWSGVNGASGTAGWFRWYPNDFDDHTGGGATKICLDGNCATSGGQMNLSSTALTSGITTTVDNVAITMPAS
jgi:hypothetical protein